MNDDIHSCSHLCKRPACVAQRIQATKSSTRLAIEETLNTHIPPPFRYEVSDMQVAALLQEHDTEVAQLKAELAAEGEKVQVLREACLRIVDAFDRLPSDHPARYAPLFLNDARAAIAKATGEIK